MKNTTANHPFNGQWITIDSLANLKPLNVFHRQLAPAQFKPEDQKARNQHVLFRKTFSLDSTENATIFISADDYYKLYINGKFVNKVPLPAIRSTTSTMKSMFRII